MSGPSVTVEMLPGGHPLLRFAYAFATRGTGERLEGQINLSIQTLEEARTLRDALSAFLEFEAQCALADWRKRHKPAPVDSEALS